MVLFKYLFNNHSMYIDGESNKIKLNFVASIFDASIFIYFEHEKHNFSHLEIHKELEEEGSFTTLTHYYKLL